MSLKQEKGKSRAQVVNEIYNRNNPKAAAINRANKAEHADVPVTLPPAPEPEKEDNYLHVGERLLTDDEINAKRDEFTEKQLTAEGKTTEEIKIIKEQFSTNEVGIIAPPIPMEEMDAILEQGLFEITNEGPSDLFSEGADSNPPQL